MNENLKSTEFLFAKMKKLYPTFVRPDEIDVLAWTDILAGYSQTDILDALKEYRKNVAYNVAPLPAKFKDYLHKADTIQATPAEEKHYLPTPTSFMDADVEAGNCHYNLPTYVKAFDLCITKFLAEVIPADIAEKASYPYNVQLAVENGVFNRFGEALRMIGERDFANTGGIQFPSKNDLLAQKAAGRTVAINNGNAINTLSAHWRM